MDILLVVQQYAKKLAEHGLVVKIAARKPHLTRNQPKKTIATVDARPIGRKNSKVFSPS